LTLAETKRWLKRAWFLDQRINFLMRKHYEEIERVQSITAQLSGMPSSPSKDPHKFDKISEIDDSIKNDVERLKKIKREIKAKVEELDDDMQKIVLMEYYIPDEEGQHKTIEEIAYDYNYSTRQTFRVYKQGVTNISKLL